MNCSYFVEDDENYKIKELSFDDVERREQIKLLQDFGEW